MAQRSKNHAYLAATYPFVLWAVLSGLFLASRYSTQPDGHTVKSKYHHQHAATIEQTAASRQRVLP